MKILHITAMSPLSPNSGIPAVLKQLTDAQNNIDGVESRVLSLVGDVDKIESTYFHFLGKEKVGQYIKREKPDIAIIHSFFHIEFVKTVKALLQNQVPFCNEPHGSFGANAMKSSALKKIIANKTIFAEQLKKAKSYIFTNCAEKNNSIYHTPNDLIIPNGVLQETVNNSREKASDSYKNPTLYFLGRFDIDHKGIDYLFDSLDVLEKRKIPVNIKFFGIGDNKQEDYVRRRLGNLNVVNAQNCGTIYGEKKKMTLESCNILVLTSRYEGSPMTVLDGLSYGNPCIVTPGTNVADEIASNKIGWKTSLDATEIADTIVRAIEEYRQDGEIMFARCKKYVLDNYSWDKIAKQSVLEYESLLQQN